MAKKLSPSRRLAAFQARLKPIEDLFAAGRIGPALRRELLIHARDLTGIPTMSTKTNEPGTTVGAGMTEEEFRERRRAADRRRYARQMAAQSGQAGEAPHA
ncbi:hypothetical protein [Azospirillum doebereinerae]|uniref:Uncharacterized protein n=1 Tax=Azospirillum doebereinerae TaxID=92933 RepID=A0A433IZR2_9PROT|nr:hypothetical protein [Azospirillum doebereinerae]RUQ61239.1 hypothetical protein EJ913_30005 [Azospirillum doebereinerae]